MTSDAIRLARAKHEALEVDPERGRPGSAFRNATGIYVRARYGDEWGSFDIATLTLDSLLAWLRSRGGDNEWAENTCAILLGHDIARRSPE